MFDFDKQLQVGKQGEKLMKLYYESQTTNDGKSKFIVRDAFKEEQLKGADFFIINQELGTRYIEVKTDTQSKDTGNVALEIQIVKDDGTKQIGCQFKTFPDFMFYWIYPTNRILYWNPVELIPHIIDWILDDTHVIVEAQNKNFFSRSILVPIDELLALDIVSEISVSYHILEKARAA